MAEKLETVSNRGVRLRVRTSGTGDRLALFLHGFPESSHSWRHQMPVLESLGYRCWAPDLRGYGASDAPSRVEDYAIETLLDDVTALIDASGAKSTTLIAHDWGAIIAWYYAMRAPRPLERLVIMNVPHPGPFRREMRTWKQLKKSWYGFFFQIPAVPEALFEAGGYRAIEDAFINMAVDKSRFSRKDLDLYKHNASLPGRMTGMINYYRALMRGGARRQHELGYPVIDIPTLMLWGEEDKALDLSTTVGTNAWVRDLTFRRLPGVSHWVQQEAPETVNEMMEAWLCGRDVPNAPGT